MTRSTFTIAVRDHQLGARVHEVVNVTLDCRSLPHGGTVIPGDSIEALDAALATLRTELIQAARFYNETTTKEN